MWSQSKCVKCAKANTVYLYMFAHFSTQVLKTCLQLTVFDLVAHVFKYSEHWPVVTNPEGMVHCPKLHLLPRIPEVRDQELTGEIVPDSEQERLKAETWVMGKGFSTRGQQDSKIKMCQLK